MKITQKYIDEISYTVIGSAITVHKQLGPGLLESIYEKCLLQELSLQGLLCESQQTVPVFYKGIQLDATLRYDVLVEKLIVTELKSVEMILPVHESILLTYMRLLQKPKGILINFNCTNIFKEGQKTLVNRYYGNLPKQ